MKHARGGGKLSVVLDTNVYVSAFAFPHGSLFPVWQHARTGTYRLLVSPAIVRELARTLREEFLWSEPQITRQLKLLVHTSELVTPAPMPEVIARDPADNHILALPYFPW
jgi:putative PIN family toxin of toxin-antitoxin system